MRHVLPLVTALVLAAPAGADDEAPSWLDGPEAPHDDDDKPATRSPREPGAQQQDLDTPPAPPDPWIPVEPPLAPPRDDLRMSTVLDRQQLDAFGDVTIADPLIVVPGLLLPHDHARGQRPWMRGLVAHTQLRLDGVPILPASAYPAFALLGALDTASVQRVVVRHGPRLTGTGGVSGAAGSIEVTTLPAAVDRGHGLPLTGRLVGAIGGPDIEKGLIASASTGIGRARVHIAGGGFDVDPAHLGRGAGMTERYDATGGHVGVMLDVTPYDGLRIFSGWRSVRHRGKPFPSLCPQPPEGEDLDCVFLDDLAFDLFLTGLDADARLFGVRLDASARAHVQHHGEHLQHSGGGVVFSEYALDDQWRAGAVADLWITPPALLHPGGFPLDVSFHVGSELLRDRVESVFGERSRRNIDAIPRGQLIEDPALARRVDDSTATFASLLAEARASFWRLEANAGARVDASRLFAPAPDNDRVPGPFLHTDNYALSGELVVAGRIGEDWKVFGALLRNQRGERLAARTLGPERFQEGPLPAPPLHDPFVEHAGELGLIWSLPWFTLEGLGFAGLRRGQLIVGTDPIEALTGDAPPRLIRGPDHRVAGVEGRAHVRSKTLGLSLLATAGATLLDEGTLLLEAQPVSGVPGPAGIFVLDWRPGDWPVSAFARFRWTLPQAALSPDELADPTLCPELVDAADAECFGALGAGIWDLGAALTPSDRLDLRVLVENVLDSPWGIHGHPLPGHGLGARFTATLSL
jgi:hypothetical protein